jgi:polyhydroxyalkanoate synthase
MHSQYLRNLFLKNSLASARLLVDGRPVSLTDIHIPIFAVGTMTDHVAPWRSVYKIIPLSDTAVTFLLTTGGHNAGVVSPPGTPGRSYQVRTHEHDGPYIDPDTWQAETRQREGSWWPAWEHWLARLAGPWVPPPPPPRSVRDAPGIYVLQP